VNARRVHPCRTCGACCASFRVSFYWGEGDDAHGVVPEELTVPISPFLRAMAGTERHPPRCVALAGIVGETSTCRIHERRPTPCREFAASWENGEPNPGCDGARRRAGLPALRPADFGR
jgi:Fe-S-cluster containining protein